MQLLSHIPKIQRRLRLLLLWSGFGILLIVLLLALAVRLALPEVGRFRPDIEARLSQILAQPVRIGQIEAGWHVGPWLRLRGVRVGDATNPQIYLPQADLEMHPLPLLWGRFAVRQLTLVRPYLVMERLADGRFKVGGKVLGGKGDDLSITLDHADMDIRGGTLDWRDAHHPGIGRIRLEQLRVQVKSSYRQHIQASVRLPQSLGQDIRLELAAKDLFSDPLQSWGDGNVSIRALHTDLLAAYFNEALPFTIGGNTTGTLAFTWGQGWVTRIQGPIRISQPRLDWPHYYAAPLQARSLALNLDWRARSGEGLLKLGNVHLDRAREHWQPFNLTLRNNLDGNPTRLEMKIDRMAVAPTLKLLPLKLLPPAWQTYLREAEPSGQVRNFQLHWQDANAHKAQRLAVSARFSGLNTQPVEKNPGFRNLNGELKLDNDTGNLTLDTRDSSLDWPYAFHQRIPIHQLRAVANWQFDGRQLKLDLPRFLFVGDFRAQGRARIVQTPGQRPFVDLTAEAQGGDVSKAPRYYPYRIMSPKLQHWLNDALQKGRLEHTELRLRGPLSRFPFANPRDGIFRVHSQFRDVSLRYLPAWPAAEKLRGDMVFDRQKLVLTARQGQVMDASLTHLRARIPDLEHHAPVLYLDGHVNTSFNTGLRFLRASPILRDNSLGRENISATGMSPLDLHLKVGLGKHHTTEIDGRLNLQQVNLRWDEWHLDQVSGPVHFSHDRIEAAGLTGDWLGGPVNFDLQASPLQHHPIIEVAARGEATASALGDQLKQGWLGYLTGSFPYTFEMTLQQEQGHYTLDSPLTGLALQLPYPLQKPASEPRALHAAGDFTIKQSLRIAANLGAQQAAQLQLQYGKQGWKPTRGAWQLGTTQVPALPAQGFVLLGQGDRLPLDEWLGVLNPETPPAAPASINSSSPNTLAALRINAHWQQVHFLGHDWPQVQVKGSYLPSDSTLQLKIQSPAVAGTVQYVHRPATTDVVNARFSHLYLPAGKDGSPATESALQLPAQGSKPLDIDAEIADLRWETYQFDHFGLQAERRPGLWRARGLQISQGKARFSGDGAWSGSGAGTTQLRGEFQTADLASTLRKFAFNTGLSAGTGEFTGNLYWPGSPLAFEAGRLSGDLRMHLRDGRFNDVSPVVKLLSLINITSMVERVFTLDFRDLFGKGLFFENLVGDLQLEDGLARARRIDLDSSAMHIKAQGDISLRDKSMDLGMQVEPLQTVDMLIGRFPVLGKALFGSEGAVIKLHYKASGPWNDPRISLVTPTRSNRQP